MRLLTLFIEATFVVCFYKLCTRAFYFLDAFGVHIEGFMVNQCTPGSVSTSNGHENLVKSGQHRHKQTSINKISNLNLVHISRNKNCNFCCGY